MKIRPLAARIAAVALAVPAIITGIGIVSHVGPAISHMDPGGDPGGSTAGGSAGVGAPSGSTSSSSSGGSGTMPGLQSNHNEIVIAD